MIYDFTRYDFGLPVDISLNSLPEKKTFVRDLKIVWVIKGEISLKNNLFSDNKKDSLINLKENDIYLINPYSEYRLVNSYKNQLAETGHLVFSLKNSFCRETISGFKRNLYNINNNYESNIKLVELRNKLFQILKIYINSDFDLFSRLNLELDGLLREIDNNFCVSSNREDDLFLKYSDDIIFKILREIDENYDKSISLKSFANKYHYNASYLSSKFKKTIRTNFKDYLNFVRLEKALKLLIFTRENISNLSLITGFGNLKSFYSTFNNHFKYSPTEYRSKFAKIKSKKLTKKFTPKFFGKYENYLEKLCSSKIDNKNAEKKIISLSSKKDGEKLKQVWNKLINVGVANSILNSNLREQLKAMQKDIGFEYLRFEGIFNDELEVCKGGNLDNINYNWKFIDEILDFLLELNIKPFISLSYMPEMLASKDRKMFYYNANYSPPQNMEVWLDLINSFMVHIINRYSLENVSKWYFQVWTEFSFAGMHWAGTDKEYYDFYKKTALKIKDISEEIKVGPASENFMASPIKSEPFLEFCKSEDIPVDFYNMNLYHNSVSRSSKINKKKIHSEKNLNKLVFEFKDKDYSLQKSGEVKNLLRKSYTEAELIVTRWNMSWHVKEYIHDTVFMADYICDNALKLRNIIDGIGYLSLSDILTEWPISESPFFGGRGIINTEGIKKASYFSFVFLSRLGTEIIEQDDYYIITREGNQIKILFYNYAYLNEGYKKGDLRLIDEKNRYSVFEEKSKLNINLNITDLSGKYKVTHYLLNRKNGSAFDEWAKMGFPHQLNNEEVSYLKHKSYPQMKVNYLEVEDSLELSFDLEVHGLRYIALEKVYEG